MAKTHLDHFEDDVQLCSYSDDDFCDNDAFQEIFPTSPPHSAFNTSTIDPDIDAIGSASDLNNYLPDSVTSQHMTPRLKDLIDMEEDHYIGVQVAVGHIIKCNKINDNHYPLFAALHGCIYIPG
jgi:hypothetical protein